MNKNVSDNFLGRMYPFFLNNYNLASQHLLYEVYSPGRIGSDNAPRVSMQKLSSYVTDPKYAAKDNLLDILAETEDKEKQLDYVDTIILRNLETSLFETEEEFPDIEMLLNNDVSKELVINLRDAWRWKFYKFLPGCYVDILYSKDKLILCKFAGEDNDIWLEPVGMYSVADTAFRNPLDIPFELKKKVWKRNDASGINRSIKTMEYTSLFRKK